MLLSRVAENLYWAARYLERAEGTARIAREHTNLIIDMPTSVMSSWEPLLVITGTRAGYDIAHQTINETDVVGYLVADRTNPGSIRSSIDQARENLRTCREVLPGPAWVTVNGLYLYVGAHDAEGVARRSRSRFLDRIVTDHQRLIGVLTTTMSRDAAYTMLRLGRHVERADMATRVLDVWATSLMGERLEERARYEHLQWASLLQALSALQMYQRGNSPVDGHVGPVRFVLDDATFPRSLRYCLDSAAHSAARLPRPERVRAAVADALAVLGRIDVAALDVAGVHAAADRLQLAIGEIHKQITSSYFRVVNTASSAE